jgi:hypothetical protein
MAKIDIVRTALAWRFCRVDQVRFEAVGKTSLGELVGA